MSRKMAIQKRVKETKKSSGVRDEDEVKPTSVYNSFISCINPAGNISYKSKAPKVHKVASKHKHNVSLDDKLTPSLVQKVPPHV